MNNYDYPMGADNPDAPWNKEEPSVARFEVIMTQTLSKRVMVSTDDYELDDDEKDTSDTDWENAYHEEHLTPLDLIRECKKMAQEKLALYKGGGSECKWLERLIKECENWETLGEEFDEA